MVILFPAVRVEGIRQDKLFLELSAGNVGMIEDACLHPL